MEVAHRGWKKESSVDSPIDQTYVSLKRINRFMNADELDPDAVSHDESHDAPLVMEGATLSWDNTGRPTLRNLGLKESQPNSAKIQG